jgi:hypothetical protein
MLQVEPKIVEAEEVLGSLYEQPESEKENRLKRFELAVMICFCSLNAYSLNT